MHFFFIICSWKLIAKTLLWDFEQCSKSGGKGLITRRNPWPWYSLLPFESKRNSQKRVISLFRETLQGRSQGAPKVHDCAPPLWAVSGPQTPRPIILDPPFLIPGYGPALVLNIAWKAHFCFDCFEFIAVLAVFHPYYGRNVYKLLIEFSLHSSFSPLSIAMEEYFVHFWMSEFLDDMNYFLLVHLRKTVVGTQR